VEDTTTVPHSTTTVTTIVGACENTRIHMLVREGRSGCITPSPMTMTITMAVVVAVEAEARGGEIGLGVGSAPADMQCA
jgi:hypothetical protein